MLKRVSGRATVAAACVALAAAVLPMSPAQAASSACSTAYPGLVSSLHGSSVPFYVENSTNTGASALYGGYAGWKVANSISASSDLWLKVSGFSSASLGLAANQSQYIPLRAKANFGADNNNRVAYAYLAASGTTATAQTFNMEVWAGKPDAASSTALCTFGNTFSGITDVGVNSSNRVDTVTASTTTPAVGQKVTVTVAGVPGSIGNQNPIMVMHAAKVINWPANALTLVGQRVTFTTPNTYNDLIYLPNVGADSGNAYTATYVFEARETFSGTATLLPYHTINQGGTVFGLNQAAGATVAITKTEVRAFITTSMTSAIANNGVRNTYTMTVNNPDTEQIVVDGLVSTPQAASGASWSYVANSATNAREPSVTASTLSFPGPFTVPAKSGDTNGTYSITFQLDVSGQVTNGVTGSVNAATLGKATNDPTAPTVTANPLLKVNQKTDLNTSYKQVPFKVYPVVGGIPSGTAVAQGKTDNTGLALQTTTSDPLTLAPGTYQVTSQAPCRLNAVTQSQNIVVTTTEANLDLTMPATTPCVPKTVAYSSGTKAVTWAAPGHDGGTSVTGYGLMYYNAARDKWAVFATNVQGTSFNFNTYKSSGCPVGASCPRAWGALQNGVEYNFRLYGINSKGLGAVSEFKVTL